MTISETLKDLIESSFSKEKFLNFLYKVFPDAKINPSGKSLPIDEKFQGKILEAELIGEYEDPEGNEIEFITVKVQSPEKLRKYQRDFVARRLENTFKDGALVAFYSDSSDIWRLSYVRMDYERKEKEGKVEKKLTNYKRFSFIVGKGKLAKTTVSQLQKLLEVENPNVDYILQVFSVDSLNDEFFEGYLKRFAELWRLIYNQVKDKKLTEKTPERFSKEVAHQLLNRLVFVYFIQEKEEWFNLKGQKLIDFLVSEYKEFIRRNPEKRGTFYSEWLKPLFLSAFSKNLSHKRAEIPYKFPYLPERVKKLFIEAPYLNGGLFSENDYDLFSLQIPDEFFLKSDELNRENEGIIPFLNGYNFTVVEDLEDDRDLAVNPEFIGTIYEKLVHLDSKEVLKNPEAKLDIEGVTKGIVYTKEPEIRFMIIQSLIHYLKKNTELPEELIYDFIFNDDFLPESREVFEGLKKALDELKVVDPACGSGAFLVEFVNTLYELYSKLHRFDPDVVESGYAIRKRIIENNVYGVDVMEWAVRIAELRLWLFLIVEADIGREQLWLKPLLPNLSFKVRVGDSLVEELGDLDFSVLRSRRKEIRSKFELPKELKRKITILKNKKLSYAENRPGAPSKKEIEHEEFLLFKEIVDKKILSVERKINSLKSQPRFEKDLFGKEERKSEELFKKEAEELEKELNFWKRLKKSLLKGKRPFIWDIDFVEVFYGDKEGFDVVIGNPPYVRQEKIAPPDKNEEDFSQKEWKELKRKYKEKLQRMVENLYGREFVPDKKADLYVYFYFKALSLLNENGTLAFITSNSWLDVGFGKSLQEFLLKRTKIYSINDNESKRSFKEADVNTVIVFTSAPTGKLKEKENLENTAKFVMWKVPFEEVVKSENFKSYLQYIDKLKPKVEDADLTELSENVVKTDIFRVFPVKQKDLLKDGSRDGKYEGNKWGGKFLRAPDIFFTVLKKGKGKLVRLGDIAEVKGGIITGNNKKFYFPYFENYDKSSFSPVFKSPREVKKILLEKKDAVSLVKIRNIPFKIKKAPLLWVDIRRAKHITHWNKDLLPFEHNFYGIEPKFSDDIPKFVLILNASLTWLFIEIFGMNYGGGGGPIRLVADTIKNLNILNPNYFPIQSPFIVKELNTFLIRKQNDIFTELGFDPDKPIREQEPNPLPDRKVLDDIVFDALGLTEEERKEVYYAVAELVQNRLKKARSV